MWGTRIVLTIQMWATGLLVEGVYLILYETHPDTDEGLVEAIEIVRIVHGHRDLSRIV
jgi:toxin ParE1/3/4